MTLQRRAPQPFNPIETAAALSRLFAETAGDVDRSGEIPRANFDALAKAELLRLTIPIEAGGHGAGLETTVKVVEWIGRGEPSTALILAMHLINHATVVRAWPTAIATRLQQESLTEVSLLNALRVEPELGTPARGGLPATIGRRGANGWRVSGHKLYSTGIPILRWLLVWGRTDEAEPRVGTFLVPSDAPGIKIVSTWNHLGIRATASHDVLLEDVAIPFEYAVDLRPATVGGRDPEYWAWATLSVAALYNGVALAARDWLVEFLKSRVPSNLGAPLASLPRMQEALGEVEALLTVNARLLSTAAHDVDAGSIPEIAESGLIKSAVTNNAISTVEIALKLSGNHGLSRDNPLERHHRDVLCGRIHTPQDDSVRVAAGRRVLGLDR
jgi:alkylation response protein AidB-like acyl-CoA dehydrogenase